MEQFCYEAKLNFSEYLNPYFHYCELPTEINNVVTIELMESICNCKLTDLSTQVFEGWGLNWI